jgi:ABC-2 type transport system permease protein
MVDEENPMDRRDLLSLFRFLRALLAVSMKASMARRGAFLMQAVFMAINNLIFFVFWWILLHRVPHIRGFRLPDLALLYGVVAAGFGLGVSLAGGVRHLARFIHEGELDAWLTQPKPTLVYAVCCRSQASGIGDVCSGLALIALSGQVRLAAVPLVAVAIASSAVVFIASGIVFFSLAFWLGQVETAARQVFEAIITFSLYPEPLFGGALRLVLFTVLPAGFVGYLPARLIREPSLEAALALVAAVAGYAAFATWLFARGLRSYCSGSRFGLFG